MINALSVSYEISIKETFITNHSLEFPDLAFSSYCSETVWSMFPQKSSHDLDQCHAQSLIFKFISPGVLKFPHTSKVNQGLLLP